MQEAGNWIAEKSKKIHSEAMQYVMHGIVLIPRNIKRREEEELATRVFGDIEQHLDDHLSIYRVLKVRTQNMR